MPGTAPRQQENGVYLRDHHSFTIYNLPLRTYLPETQQASNAFPNQANTRQGLARQAVPVLQYYRKVEKPPVAIVQRNGTRALPLAGGEEKGEVKLAPPVQVGGDQGAWLEKGSQAILLIKLILLPFGSGNVKESIVGSKSQSLSRLTTFRNMSYLDPEEKEKPVTVGTLQMGDMTDPKIIIQSAISAAVAQGGNCLQNGQIAYALLNLLLPGGTPIALVQPDGCDHAFTVIGDIPDGPVTKEMGTQFVCVDAWPHVAKACLLSDSYFGDWKKAHVVKGKAAGGGMATPFFEEVEKQKKLVTAYSESSEPVSDRTERQQRKNIKTAMSIIKEHKDRDPDKKDFEGAYDQMTIFKDDIVPQYITPSHPDYKK